MKYSVLLLAMLGVGQQVQAHPVTYVGGVVWSTAIRPKMSIFETNTTFARSLAFGLTYRRFELMDREVQSLFPQLNWLVKRWNFPDAQANIYTSGGIGYQEDSIERNGIAGYASIQADYETRRIYTAVKAEVLHTANVDPYLIRYRFGVAPYEGKFNELQTWAIAQFDWVPDVFSNLQFTPTVRFFYQNILWELGSTLKGNWRLQLMVHF